MFLTKQSSRSHYEFQSVNMQKAWWEISSKDLENVINVCGMQDVTIPHGKDLSFIIT